MQVFLRSLFVTSLALVGGLAAAEDSLPDGGAPWRSLPLIRDGKADPAWTHLWGGGFTVLDEGALRTACTDAGMGLLLYSKEKFGNCQIRVVYRCQNEKSNAGIYVRIDDGVLERAKDPLPLRERDSTGKKLTKESLKRLQDSSEAEKEAWYPVHHGYEIQISDAGDEYHRSGAVYSLAPAAVPPKKDPAEWKTMVITLQGNVVLVDIDGKRVTTFDPDSPSVPKRKQWTEPKREPKRPLSGYIGLQNHDPGDVVDFKDVSVRSLASSSGPYSGKTFKGRIAWSADGNHNDRDDWAASPVALAIFAECGLKDRLVHFEYNCILPLTDAEWEKIHAASVLGAAERYGYDKAVFHDCRQDLEASVASLANAANQSTADNPLYFVVAGPMQAPVMGLLKADPEKRKHVYCISHSRWNDGYSQYKYTHTKRDVIAAGVNWVQIVDQNKLLSVSPYKRPATEDEWGPFLWMRDSQDAKVRFLWERMKVSTRPDPSDAGMAYFLATGDELCDPAKLKRLLEDKQPPTPLAARAQIRLEAENFRQLEGCAVEDTKDKGASHLLQVRLSGPKGRIQTTFAEPFAPVRGNFDVAVRFADEAGRPSEYALLVNGVLQGAAWKSSSPADGWQTHKVRAVEIKTGDEIEVVAAGARARFDFVQLQTAVLE